MSQTQSTIPHQSEGRSLLSAAADFLFGPSAAEEPEPESEPEVDLEAPPHSRLRSAAQTEGETEAEGGETEGGEAEEEPSLGPMIDQCVIEAATILMTNHPGSDADQILGLLESFVSASISEAEIAQEQAGETWDDPTLARVLREKLVSRGRTALTETYGELGSKLLLTHPDAALGSGSGSGSGSAEGGDSSSGVSGSTAMVTSGGTGWPPGPTRGNVCIIFESWSRENWANSMPNNMRFALSNPYGVDLSEGISNVVRVTLRGVNVNESPLFGQMSGGTMFYIGIEEITGQYNRQSFGGGTTIHFQCFAKPRARGGGVEIQIISGTIDLPANQILLTQLTFRLYDSFGRDLPLEQDIHPITDLTWDDVGQSLVVTIGPHYIRNGDSIIVRGLTCVEDPYLFADTKRFVARIRSHSTLMIQAWRDPLLPRTLVRDEARLIDLNNQISITVGLEHIY